MNDHTPHRHMPPAAMETIADAAGHIERSTDRLRSPAGVDATALQGNADDMVHATALLRDYIRAEAGILREADRLLTDKIAELTALRSRVSSYHPSTLAVIDTLLHRYKTRTYQSPHGPAYTPAALGPAPQPSPQRPPITPLATPPGRTHPPATVTGRTPAGYPATGRVPVSRPATGQAPVVRPRAGRAASTRQDPIAAYRPEPPTVVPSTVATGPVPTHRTGAHRLADTYTEKYPDPIPAEPV